jgi:hypothetical protein
MPKAVSPTQPIAVLDTTTLIWSAPQFENINTPKLDSIPTLGYHTATLLQNKFMVVAFGKYFFFFLRKLCDVNNLLQYIIFFTLLGSITDSQENNNDIYVFDLGKPKFQWFRLENSKSLTTPETSPTTSSPGSKDPHPLSKPAIIIGLSIGIVVIIMTTIIATLLIRRYIKRRPTVIKTPGDSRDDYYMNQRFESTPQYYHNNLYSRK